MLKREEYLKTVKRPYPPLFCSLVCVGYSDEKQFKGLLVKQFFISNMAHVDDVWYYSKAEVKEGGKLTLLSWQDDMMFKHAQKEFKRREKNLIQAAAQDFKSYSDAYIAYMPALALVFIVSEYVETALREAIKEKLPGNEVEELMGKLNVPLQDNVHKLEEYELVTSHNIKKHVQKYRWLYARYGEDREYTVEEAREKLSGINKEEFLRKWKQDKEALKNTISNAKGLLGKKSCLVDIFQYVVYYRTHRTDVMNKSSYFAMPMLRERASLLGITYEQLLRCCINEVLNNKIPPVDVLDRRIRDCSTLLEDGKTRCIEGKESVEIIRFFQEDAGDVNELKGVIACKGNVTGNAILVRDRSDFGKVRDGNVLVTSMTTPEMVPILKNVSAIVTDEGGVTSHAAIISREMNIPCIIGTKIATQVLNDGDMVEVDAEKGIVKILKS